MRSSASQTVGVGCLLSVCLALGAKALHIEVMDGIDQEDSHQMEIIEETVKEQNRILKQEKILDDVMVTIDESFNITIQEEGWTYNLTVGFDSQNNYKIHDVPKHRHLLASRYVTDQDQGIELQVIWETEVCKLKKVYLTSTYQQEKAVYLGESIPGQDTFNSQDAMLLQFVDIDGPSLLRSSLPSSFQPYCPHNFDIIAVHHVRQNWDEIETNGNETILATNPAIIQEGGILSYLEDLGLSPLHRTKRSHCVDLNGNTVFENCHWREITCPFGCRALDVFMKCRAARAGELTCDYVITCNPNYRDPLSPGEQKKCMAHLNSVTNKCRTCCSARNCGGHMPLCFPGWGEKPF